MLWEYTDWFWQLSICRSFLEIDWFHGDQVPSEIENIADNDQVLEESDSDSDVVESDDSEFEDDGDFYF